MEQDNITTAELAKQVRATVSNASNKLRALSDGGYILRREQVAVTGGIEYVYKRVR
jgi:predicted transcriptional regulator